MAFRAGIEVNNSAKGTNSSELGLDAIAKAFEEISRMDISRSRQDDLEFREIPPARPPSVGADAISSVRRLAFGKVTQWVFIGFAVVCIGAIAFAWLISGGRTDNSAASPASISMATGEKQPLTTQAIPSIATAKSVKSPEQPIVQAQITPKPADPALLVASDTTQRIQSLERRLINLEQGIEQIKSDQAKLARENANLLGSLRDEQEKLVLRVQEFASEAKAAEEKAMRDRLTAAEQLRVNQEQLVKVGEQLKAGQDQIDQTKIAAQRRMSKLASPPSQVPGAPAATPKPAPKPPQQSGASRAQTSLQPQGR